MTHVHHNPLVTQVDPSSNEQRVGRALTLLNNGLKPFVKTVLSRLHGEKWLAVVYQCIGLPLKPTITTMDELDTRYLLQLITKLFQDAFHTHSNLTLFHKGILHELRQTRNDWAHQQKLSGTFS
jgi:hypothetical protein